MGIVDIKRQGQNYLAVLRWVFRSYYQSEKGSFWLIQLLMGMSVALSLLWLLGVIAGLNHLNDSTYLAQFDLQWLSDFFSQPLWLWLGLLSLAGLIGAGATFLSFYIGVQSVIRFQVILLNKLLKTINLDAEYKWLHVVADDPRKKVHRIIKMSVQLTGLVIRRLVRMLVPLLTFCLAFVALIKLDAPLLLNLIPLALLYVVALYFINRYAARTQVKLIGVADPVNRKMSGIINDMMFRKQRYDESIKQRISDAKYTLFSRLRYQRRLAEIHVVWVNSLFLIFGSALIIVAFGLNPENGQVDWMHLILFLVALRYAGNGLQEMASATVSFSRFLPDTEMVHQLLTASKPVQSTQAYSGVIFVFFDNPQIEVLLPQLMQVKYGAKDVEVISQATVLQGKSGLDQTAWYCGTKPRQFKQAVRKNRGFISHIISHIDGDEVVYKSVDDFLTTFDPHKIKPNGSSVNEADDEMY